MNIIIDIKHKYMMLILNRTLISASFQTSQLESTLTSRVRPQLLELEDIFDGPVRDISAGAALQAALRIVQGNTSVAAGAAGDMRRPLGGISLAATLNVGVYFIIIF